jgi:hypothetical protein
LLIEPDRLLYKIYSGLSLMARQATIYILSHIQVKSTATIS